MIPARLAILGSTGSIGTNALRSVADHPQRFAVTALAAGANTALLAEQVLRFRPRLAVVKSAALADDLHRRLPAGHDVDIRWGEAGYAAAASDTQVQAVVAAIMGAAGLLPTLAAVRAGKLVALANKETLVMAGGLVLEAARASGAVIRPVDSEHSAIFQCLQGQRRQDLARIVLTASGGPLRTTPLAQMATVSPQQALSHPTWSMGRKISIDSATLMNKGLEVIEARWLFDVAPEQIEVLVHPQSIVHSMVAFGDGSMLAQLGVPDMRGAIAYALTCPERLGLGIAAPDLAALGSLTFAPPDRRRFPCLDLAYKALRAGGTAPAVLNGANEAAVEAFLEERLAFTDIAAQVAAALEAHALTARPDLDAILDADRWARRFVRERSPGARPAAAG
jgi:1-deoxy-D-xylulose-5-phosphate reductoisomerase